MRISTVNINLASNRIRNEHINGNVKQNVGVVVEVELCEGE